MSAPALSVARDRYEIPEIQQSKIAKDWFGRKVHVLYEFLKEFSHGLLEGVKKVIRVIAKLFNDPSSLARFCRIGVGALTVCERIIGKPGIFSAVNQKLATTDAVVNTVGVLDQVQYFGTGQQKEKSVLNSLGNGALLVAGIVGVVTFIGQMVLLGLSKGGSAFGRTPTFQVLSKVADGVGRAGAGIAAAAFGCFAVDAIENIVHGKTREEKVQGWINLAWHVAEIAFAVLAAVACTSLAAVIVVGSAAAVLGISSFLYNIYVQDKGEHPTPPSLKLINT